MRFLFLVFFIIILFQSLYRCSQETIEQSEDDHICQSINISSCNSKGVVLKKKKKDFTQYFLVIQTKKDIIEESIGVEIYDEVQVGDTIK